MHKETSMKRATVIATLLWLSANTFAASTMSGTISDSMCGSSHGAMTEHGTKMTDKQCSSACIQHGAKYVFVENGKVFQIANQEFTGLAQFAGDIVRVTGEVRGDKLTLQKIEAAQK
jgi:hypothetical protein